MEWRRAALHTGPCSEKLKMEIFLGLGWLPATRSLNPWCRQCCSSLAVSGGGMSSRTSALGALPRRPVLADSVEKLQTATTPNFHVGALRSTIRSANRRGACQSDPGRAQQKIARSSTSEQDQRLCGPGISPVVPEREFFNRIGREGASRSILSPFQFLVSFASGNKRADALGLASATQGCPLNHDRARA
jgi:hypothetical protein